VQAIPDSRLCGNPDSSLPVSGKERYYLSIHGLSCGYSADVRDSLQVSHDQHGHLDALLRGMLMLVNLMPGKSYLGIFLGSGGCINAMRKLIEEEYDGFESVFHNDLTKLMKGTDEEEKLERAWRIYSRRRLEELGFGDKWKRAYLELDEFDLFMGSYSVFHFGARFPLFFGDDALRAVPLEWYNLRLHLYSGDKDVPAGQSGVCKNGHAQAVQNDTIPLEDPIPWYDPDTQKTSRRNGETLIRAFHRRWNGMKALNQFRPCN
jgi:hypothetical protein